MHILDTFMYAYRDTYIYAPNIGEICSIGAEDWWIFQIHSDPSDTDNRRISRCYKNSTFPNIGVLQWNSVSREFGGSQIKSNWRDRQIFINTLFAIDGFLVKAASSPPPPSSSSITSIPETFLYVEAYRASTDIYRWMCFWNME